MHPAKMELVRTAGRLFSEKGFYGTSIRDIAEARGIRSGSLYAHIATKEDLLFEVVLVGSQAFLEALEPLVAAPLPPQEQLMRALAAHLEVVARHREAAWVFLHEWRLLSPARREIIQVRRDRYDRLWDEIVRQGIARGAIRPLPVRYARLACLSVANWAYLWYDPDGPLDPPTMAATLGDLLWRGLAAAPAAEGPAL